MKSQEDQKLKRHQALLWQALILPTVVWLAHLTASFTLATYACPHDFLWVNHLMTVVALLLVLASLYGGWKSFNFFREGSHGSADRFLSLLALLTGALLVLILITSELANFMVEPCV